ncbi:MAG: hypothetical protein ACRCTF_06155 [Bacteroidales bacterium]
MEYIGKCFDYISRVTGYTVIREDGTVDKKGLPFIVTGSFDMLPISIDSHGFIILLPIAEIEFTGGLFVKRVNMVEQALGVPCLLVLDEINPDMRRTLISNRINFVVADRQLNLPSLLLFMTERGVGVKRQHQPILSPAAQVILFYHLIKEPLDGLKLVDISLRVGYALKTVSNAVLELIKAEVCGITQPDKRTKIVRFLKSRKKIWTEAQSRLSSPIVNTYYVDSKSLLEDAIICYSYDSALSRTTMITHPAEETYAIEKSNPLVKRLQESGELHPHEGNVRLEIWKYPPSLLAADEIVDTLSLWMCYRMEEDERVDGELERLIEKRLEER